MTTRFNGKITTDIRDSTPDWGPYRAPQAKEGAPNVLMLVWDDLGYATMDNFGGPVETPNMKRLTDRGVKYSNFHTTALCSPSRSSLQAKKPIWLPTRAVGPWAEASNASMASSAENPAAGIPILSMTTTRSTLRVHPMRATTSRRISPTRRSSSSRMPIR